MSRRYELPTKRIPSRRKTTTTKIIRVDKKKQIECKKCGMIFDSNYYKYCPECSKKGEKR